jgi:hypothetical protein
MHTRRKYPKSCVMHRMHTCLASTRSTTIDRSLRRDLKFCDAAFSPRSKQVGVPACDAFLDGFNAAVFAYGQTGSGKTHTMFGDLGGGSEGAGLIPRSLARIFSRIETLRSGGCVVKCSCTHVEIYNEQVSATTKKTACLGGGGGGGARGPPPPPTAGLCFVEPPGGWLFAERARPCRPCGCGPPSRGSR